jgi:hypothetical protein
MIRLPLIYKKMKEFKALSFRSFILMFLLLKNSKYFQFIEVLI